MIKGFHHLFIGTIYGYFYLKYSYRFQVILFLVINQNYIKYSCFAVSSILFLVNFFLIKSIILLRCILFVLCSVSLCMLLDARFNNNSKDDNYYLNLMFFYANIINICNFVIWLCLQQIVITSVILQFIVNHRFFVTFVALTIVFFILNVEEILLWNDLFVKPVDEKPLHIKQLDRYSERCIKILRTRMWLHRNKHIMDWLFNVGGVCLIISMVAKKLLTTKLPLLFHIFFACVGTTYFLIITVHYLCLLFLIYKISKKAKIYRNNSNRPKKY